MSKIEIRILLILCEMSNSEVSHRINELFYERVEWLTRNESSFRNSFWLWMIHSFWCEKKSKWKIEKKDFLFEF